MLKAASALIFLCFSLAGSAQRVTFNERNKLHHCCVQGNQEANRPGLYLQREGSLKKADNVTIVVNNEEISGSLENNCSPARGSASTSKDKSITHQKKRKRNLLNSCSRRHTTTIRGKVMDNKEVPLIDATVRAKNANRSVVTNEEGNFVYPISIPKM